MRVAVYYNNRDIRVVEQEIPRIGAGELLLKVIASGICGSDLMEWYQAHKTPCVLGHEVAGEVAQVGAGVTRFKVGDRLVATHHVPCNQCRYCLTNRHTVCETLRTTHFDPGGYAEYLRLTPLHVDRGVYTLPPELGWEEASMTEPVASALRAQRKVRVGAGQLVLVIGSGLSGILHIQLARAFGAEQIVAADINPSRLKAAQRFGADHVIKGDEDIPQRLKELCQGRLADVVILTTGVTPAILQGLKSVDRGGTVLLYAPAAQGATIPVPVNDLFFRHDATLTTSYAASPVDLIKALEWMQAGKLRLKEMVTHRLDLSEIGRGFQLVGEAKESLKVIIFPHLKTNNKTITDS